MAKTEESSPPQTQEGSHITHPLAPKDEQADMATDGQVGTTHAALNVVEVQGDLFADIPANCLLIHACNTRGTWGAGIAAEFKRRYPRAFGFYRSYCVRAEKASIDLVGTALVIPALDGEDEDEGEGDDGGGGGGGGAMATTKACIACLFTSRKAGRARDGPNAIVANTEAAFADLMERLGRGYGEGGGMVLAEMRTCKLNAGLFNVPWERTRRVVEAVEVRHEAVPKTIKVYVV